MVLMTTTVATTVPLRKPLTLYCNQYAIAAIREGANGTTCSELCGVFVAVIQPVRFEKKQFCMA